MAHCIICYNSVTHTPISSDEPSPVINPKDKKFPDATAKKETTIQFFKLIENRNGLPNQNDNTSRSPFENVTDAGFLSCEDCSRDLWYFCELQKRLRFLQGSLMRQLHHLDIKILTADKESKPEQFLARANEQGLDGWSLLDQIDRFRKELVPKSKQCLQRTLEPILNTINTATESAPDTHFISISTSSSQLQTGHETPSSSNGKDLGNCRGVDEPKSSGFLMVTLDEQSDEQIDVNPDDPSSTSNLDPDEMEAMDELEEMEVDPIFIKFIEDPKADLGELELEFMNQNDTPHQPSQAEAPEAIPKPERIQRANEIVAGGSNGNIGVKDVKLYDRAPNPNIVSPNGAPSSNQKMPGKCVQQTLEGEVDPSSTPQFIHTRGATEVTTQLPCSSSDWIQPPIKLPTILGKDMLRCSFCPLHFAPGNVQSHMETCPAVSNNSRVIISRLAKTSPAMPTQDLGISQTSAIGENSNLGVGAFQGQEDHNQRLGGSHQFVNDGRVGHGDKINNRAGNDDSSTVGNDVALESEELLSSSDSGGPKI